MRAIHLGRILGLEVSLTPVAVALFGLLAALAAVGARAWLRLDWPAAALAGGLSALVWMASDGLHQLGHAWAARRVGYPMRGLHFSSLFAASRYPDDEPALPARVHVRRALGGFWVNLVLGLLLAVAAFALWPRGAAPLGAPAAVLAWTTAFGAVINVLVLGLGALLPLRLAGGLETDGATLLKHWRSRRG
jgi:hypothetical protein